MSDDVLEHVGLSRPNTAAGKLQRIALAWLKEKERRGEIPTSMRFVFYELEQQGHVSKRAMRKDGGPSKRKPDQNLCEAITLLREVGLVPWDWIVDETRAVTDWRFDESVRDYLIESVDYACLDRFPGLSQPLIICESRGVGGVLSRGVAHDYLVTVAPVGGQCAGFLRTMVAPLLSNPRGRHVIYIGDYDLAGDGIEANSKRVLEQASGFKFHDEPTAGRNSWERLALTKEQCEQLKREGVSPIRKEDRRHKDRRPHEAFECEALGQGRVEAFVRARLEELAPEPLESVLEREKEEREEARRLLSRWE
jgi:hypothetical protein